MQVRFQYLMIAATMLLLASCTKKNTQGKLIPATASIVVQVDGKSLSEKLPWDEVKNNPLLKEAYGDSTLPAAVKKLLDNPASSGIDIAKDLLFFVQKDSSGGYIGFEGSIKDEVIFKNFNTEITENGSASEKDGVNFISKFPVSVGWNKEKFVYVFDAPQLAQMDQLSRRMMTDSIDISSHSPRDIGATCKSIFALKESNSLAEEEKFTKLLTQPGDIHFWMNVEELSKNSAASAALAMVNLEKLYKGSITTAAVNFDNGKITANTFSYAGKELTSLYKKYSGGKVNEDMLKRMPGKDVVAVIAMNFQPEGIREFLKLLNLDGFVNLAKPTLGFDLDDFVKANKGDIMIGLSDFKLATDTSKYLFKDEEAIEPVMPKPTFNFMFAASIGDKEAFNKLVNAGKKAGNAFVNDTKLPISYNSNGTYFALGNSKENVDKYIAGGSTSNFDFISKITGQPFGGFLNIQSLMRSLQSQAGKDSAVKALFDVSLKTWDNVLWKGGEFKDGALTQSFEINLMDKNTNSLKQLNQYAAKLAEVQIEKKRKQKQDMMAFEDSVLPGNLKDSLPSPKASHFKEK